MNKKIVFSIFLAFIISFSIFIIFQYNNWNSLGPLQEDFFNKNIKNSKSTILLLGASDVGMLNVTRIQSSITEKYENYEVFNLAISGDKPSKRLRQIDEIILFQPKIILYGIGLRDLSSENYLFNDYLPNPSIYVSNFFWLISPPFFDNPKLVTLNFLKDLINYRNEIANFEEHTPFFHYKPEYDSVTNLEELEKMYNDDNQLHIPKFDNNKEFKSLKFLLEKFSENDIKIILVITPHNSYYTNSISQTDKENFYHQIDILKSNSNVDVFSLMNNYSKMNIWLSENHISHGPEGKIYDENISEIISQILKNK